MRTHINAKIGAFTTSLILFLSVVQAQTLWLLTQEDVNAVSGITTYPYNIHIGNVIDLEPLSALTEVGGNLTLSCYQVPDLSGLRSLQFVGGNLTIPSADNIQGMVSLTTVGGTLNLNDSYGRTDFRGLESIQTIGDDLNINGCIFITSLRGLEGIRSIGGSLILFDNFELVEINALAHVTSLDWIIINDSYELINLDGLSQLTSVSGNFIVDDCWKLANIAGLANLQTVGGDFVLSAIDLLPNLHGLEQLQTITGNFALRSNLSLTSIEELQNLDFVGGTIFITNNTLLSICSIPILCTAGGTITLDHNGPGCNSIEEICPPELDDLVELITSMDLPAGISNGLLAKLDASQNACERGNQTAAINNLQAFINQVEAQRGKKIPIDDADALIEMAEAIIANGLDCDLISPPTFQGPSSRPANASWYPNPTNGFIFSNHPFSHAVIYNALGQEVLVQEQGNEIDLSNQKPGVYLIKIENQMHRIIKQ